MKKFLLCINLLAISTITSALQLPINRPSREETVILELILKDIQDYVNVQKPVAASSRIEDAQDELRRIRMYLNSSEEKQINDYINQLIKEIEEQKEYQMKHYGRILEVN